MSRHTRLARAGAVTRMAGASGGVAAALAASRIPVIRSAMKYLLRGRGARRETASGGRLGTVIDVRADVARRLVLGIACRFGILPLSFGPLGLGETAVGPQP